MSSKSPFSPGGPLAPRVGKESVANRKRPGTFGFPPIFRPKRSRKSVRRFREVTHQARCSSPEEQSMGEVINLMGDDYYAMSEWGMF